MTTAQHGGKIFSSTHRPPLPPGNAPCTHFCYRLCRPQGHSVVGWFMSMKNPNDTIWERTATVRCIAHLTHCATAVPICTCSPTYVRTLSHFEVSYFDPLSRYWCCSTFVLISTDLLNPNSFLEISLFFFHIRYFREIERLGLLTPVSMNITSFWNPTPRCLL